MSPTVSVNYRPDGVAVLTFDAPESRANVLSEPVWNQLKSALRTLRVRDGVNGLVLASAKPNVFIAGADLKFFADVPRPNNPKVELLVELGLTTLDLLESLPFPTCAAINGATLGGGLEVALACDVRVAGPNPRVELGLPEVNLGLIPGWGGTQRLPRVADVEQAVIMLLGGGSLNAADSHRARLIDEVITSEDLLERAVTVVLGTNPDPVRRAKREPLPLIDQELVKDLLRQATSTDTPAARELKAVLTRGSEQPLPDALKIESAAFLRLAGSEDSKIRIADFFASRKKG